MFQKSVLPLLHEISHKSIERPETRLYYKHTHSYHELLLFLHGDADYNIGGKIFTPEPYDLLLIPQTTYHYLMPNSQKRYENYVIGFEPSLLGSEKSAFLFSKPGAVNLRSDGRILSYFTALDEQYARYLPADFDRAVEWTVRSLLLWLGYAEFDTDTPPFSGNGIVDAAIAYIDTHLEADLSAAALSEALNFSPSYLRSTFASWMHISLGRYVIEKKIYAAANALKTQQLSPHEAADKYGFANYTTFYRQFRTVFGTSPNRFRTDTLENSENKASPY